MESTPKASTEYLEELRIQLRSQGFTVHCNESRDIDVEHDGNTLYRINDCGNQGISRYCKACKNRKRHPLLGR